MTPGPRGRVPVWALVSLAWAGPAVLAVFQRYAHGRLGNFGPAGWRDLLWEGGDWLIYAALTPGVFALSRRFPLSRSDLARRVPWHALLAVGFCAAWAGAGVLLSLALLGDTPYGGSALGWFFTSLPFGVAVYFAVVGVEHASRYLVEAREREMQAARLEAQLAEARLGALRQQMQPHFLLNSLNAIGTIVRDRDHETATHMLDELGELLRHVMRADRPAEVPLREELDFVERYLGIERVRFPDRLRPEIAVAVPLLDAPVPEFVLQPLVENAIRHGLARREGATLLRIEAQRVGDALVLAVTDDGPGPGAATAERAGQVGLTNLRERLRTMYGARATLTLASTPEGGARVEVRLPWRGPAAGDA